jgi:hypothetical protein
MGLRINNTTNAIESVGGDLEVKPAGGSNVVVDGLRWPSADGASYQLLKTDGSGNLGWRDPPALLSAPQIISENTTLYVGPSGNDTTGNGTQVNPWATLHKAFDYLKDYWINPGVTVTVQLLDGLHSYTQRLEPIHPCLDRIVVTGTTTYSRTISSVSARSGSAGNWSVTLALNDASNIAIGDWVNISGTGGSNYYLHLQGCHYVSGVSGNTITVTIKHKSANMVTAAAYTGTVDVLKTVVSFTGVSGIFHQTSGRFTLTKLALVGNNTAGTIGITVAQDASVAAVILTAPAGVANFGYGVAAYAGGYVQAVSCCISGHSLEGMIAANGGQIRGGYAVSSGNGGTGLYCGLGSLANVDYAVVTGNSGHGVMAIIGAVISIQQGKVYSNLQHGVVAMNDSAIDASGCLSMLSGYTGYTATYGSTINAPNATGSNNGTSGFTAGQGGTVYANASTSQNNTNWGYYSEHNSVVVRTSSLYSGNGSGNYSPSGALGTAGNYEAIII